MWAPDASFVEVVLGDDRVHMAAAEAGWWRVEVESAGHGTDYRYSIDGGDPRPDPRSRSQPHGIHGPSRVVDHAEFRWTDHDWSGRPLAGSILYELHVGTFTSTGTFDAVVEKLDHLVSLGVGAIELCPVAEFPGRHGWGYDGVDLYAPHGSYGGADGLKRLVDACHARGIAVVLDVVYNHLGPAGNYLGDFGPYFTDRYATPWGQAINFDGPESTQVRRFFVENVLQWLRDYHCDGVRLDAVHAIVDTSAVHILEEIGDSVRKLEAELGRTLWVIAESDLNDPRVVGPKQVGGFGLDAQWSDDFHHSLHALLTGERNGYYADFGTIAQLAKALRNVFVYDWTYSSYRRRRHGRPLVGLSGHRFLGYMQNHDQVGNRARGDRSSVLMNDDLLRVAAALVITSPFVPMLFQGEEWAARSPFLYFTDHDDPELGTAVSEGRRREFEAFGWEPDEVPDPQDEETFRRSKLDWAELDDPRHADMLDWHRRLIRLRKEIPDLSDGRLEAVVTIYDEDDGWLIVERGVVTIVCNFSDEAAAVDLEPPRTRRMLLSSAKEPAGKGGTLRLEPQSVTIFSE